MTVTAPTPGIITKYYTASNAVVYFVSGKSDGSVEPIEIDTLNSIRYTQSNSARPVYGIGRSDFSFLNAGNNIVTGQLTLNFTNADIVERVLSALAGGTSQAASGSITTLKGLRSASVAKVNESNALRDIQEAAGKRQGGSISSYPAGFDIYIQLNNSGVAHSDTSQFIKIKNVRIMAKNTGVSIEGGSQIVDTYSFIGQTIH